MKDINRAKIFYRDPDFKKVLFFASFVIIYFIWQAVRYIKSADYLKSFNDPIIDPEFILIGVIAFCTVFTVKYATFKLAKQQNNNMFSVKSILALIYSLFISYFIIYKLIISDFYYVNLVGGDWGYLAVFLGWPVYLITLIPLLIILRTKLPRLIRFLVRIQIYAGLLVLILLTFTGRFLYDPIYKYKIRQIATKVVLKPTSLYSVNQYDKSCDCTQPKKKVRINIENKTSFTVVVTLKKSLENSPNNCFPIEHHLLPNLKQIFEFDCGYESSNTDSLEIIFEEKNNAAVKFSKRLYSKDFPLKFREQ